MPILPPTSLFQHILPVKCSPLMHSFIWLTRGKGKWMKVLLAQSCPTLCDPMNCSPPGSSVHGILQARIMEWVAIAFSRGSSWPRGQTRVSHIAGKFVTIWATRETWLTRGTNSEESEAYELLDRRLWLCTSRLVDRGMHVCSLTGAWRCPILLKDWDENYAYKSSFL